MRLKSIKIAGFKSFAEPTRLAFPGRITCIVGPNGCGKSNTLDAIRWVMGESTAKALRGGEMNDVLFNGTSHRKPVSQAAVELVFDNSDHALKGPWNRYESISVRRVHHREQGTQYYLNGQRCRRRDIQALFDGTGLGPRSYALIGQGNIAQIIEARPEQLRLFLEEVAGVGYYRQRRKEALARLEAAEENLAQLNIQYETWAAQAAQLEAQCEDAKRFKELQAEIKALTRLRYQLGYQQLLQRQHSTQAQWTQQQQTLIQLQQQWEDAQKAYILLEQQLPAYKSAYEKAQAAAHEQDKALALLKADYARQQAQKQQWHTQLIQLETQHTALEEQLQTVTQTLAQLTQQQQHLKADEKKQAWRQQLETLDSALQKLQQSLSDAEKSAQKQAYQLKDAQHRKNTLLQECSANRLFMAHIKERLQQVDTHLEQVHQELQQLNLQALEDSLQQMHQQLEQAQVLQKSHAQALAQAEAQHLQDSRALSELVQQRHQYSAQLKALQSVQQKALPNETEWPPEAIPLLERIEIKAPEWAEAIEAWLGERLLGALVSEWRLPPLTPFMVIAQQDLCITVQPPVDHWQALHTLIDAPYAILQAASRVFCSQIPPKPEELQMLTPFQQVLTPDGYLWEAGAVLSPRQTHAGMLVRKLEIQHLQARLEDTLHQLSVQERKAQAAQDTVKQQQQKLQAAQAQVAQAQQAYQSASLELSHAQRQQEKYQHQLKQWQQEATQLQQRLTTLEAQQRSLTQALETAEKTLTQLEAAQADTQEAYQQLKLDYETKRHQKAELEANLAQIMQAEEQLNQTLSQTRQQQALLLQQHEQITTQRQQLQHIQQQQHEIDAAQLQQAQQACEQAEEARKQHHQALSALEQQLKTQQAEVAKAERAYLKADQQVHQLEHKLSLLQQQLSDWVQEASEDGLNLALLKQQPLQPSYKTAQEVDKALKALHKQLDALGAVNMTAIETLENLQAEMAQLKTQVEDVTSAVNTLKASITRMDRDSRKRLRETFAAVNNHFQCLFPKIFNGGKAHLSWAEPDLDPLLNGVHVMAQPPGKRTTRIQILSGGEKTLTALALIFAIFELIPAPFCVLDEVDAPLDDANVNRFCALVNSMAEKVQFILITHNKITMSAADQLLGVTMHEPGVSRIVTVDLKTALDISGEAHT